MILTATGTFTLADRVLAFVKKVRKLGFRAAVTWARGRSTGRRQARVSLKGAGIDLLLRPGTSDWTVMEDVFVHGDYDIAQWPRQAGFLREHYEAILASGDVPIIIDCGANIGCASIHFAQLFPKARVLAIEPEPDNFALLRANLSPFPLATPIRAAISDRVGTLFLQSGDGQPWGWATVEDDASETVVETVTIPDLVRSEPRARLLVVKIDVEGAEKMLFRANTDWTREAPLIVVEMHDWLDWGRGSGHAVLSCLTQTKREYLQRRENLFSFRC